MIYFVAFLAAAILSCLITILVRRYALKQGIVDRPDGVRKAHALPTPLLGGAAPFLAFWFIILGLLALSHALVGRYIASQQLLAIFMAGLFLLVGGFLDDKYGLPPRKQIIFPLLAVAAILTAGIGIDFVTNPLGSGFLQLDRWSWPLFTIGGQTAHFVLLADLFTVIWLLGMIYTTKFLDGLDGLVSGMAFISAFIIFALSLSAKTFQPDVALLAIVFAGAMLGFLVWNIYPARIFLGEGGSVWAGFMLGVLAIISGGKVATALLVMGIPVLDVAWVIIRRAFFDKHSPAIADRKHLHFRLLTAGFSVRQSVLLLWGLAAAFGIASLFLQTKGKVYSLFLLFIVMLILALWSNRHSKPST